MVYIIKQSNNTVYRKADARTKLYTSYDYDIRSKWGLIRST